jgi:predicted ester cyclase
MAESRNKAVYRRFVEEVINKGNTSIIPELYHADYVDHSAPPGAEHSGSVFEQVAAIPKMFRGAFPDVHFTIDFMVEEGDWVATHVTGRAQHIGGPFAGIEPSGWKVEWTSEGMFRMQDGKIAEHYGAPDIFGLRMQVTRVPEKGSLDEARAIVTRYVYHVNKQDYDDFDKYVVEDYLDHDPIPGQQPGREGLKSAYRAFSDAFPDIWFTFEDLIAEGDLVIGRGLIEGTNKAPFLMLPATNKRVKWTGTRMFRVRDGKVSEGWINFDMLAVLQQLGMMPSGPSNGDGGASAPSQIQQVQDAQVDKNIDLVKRYFETIWNRGELQRESEFVAKDIVVHQSPIPGLRDGIAGPLQIVGMFRASIPDIHLEHTVIFGEGDKVVHRWEAKGHHTGAPLFGAPITNKELVMTGINEYRIANGLIAERWGHMDIFGVIQQLGLAPS